MAVYYANRNLTPDQSDQWPMSFPPLPPSEYDRFLGWSMLGMGLASSEPVPPPQNAQMEYADVSSTETYSLDTTKDFWYPSGYPNVRLSDLPPGLSDNTNQLSGHWHDWVSYTWADQRPSSCYIPRA